MQKSVARLLASKPFCEDDRCRIYMDTACRSGMNPVECRHLQQVGIDSDYRETVKLSETFLLDPSPDGPYKMLKTKRIQECLSLFYRLQNCIMPNLLSAFLTVKGSFTSLFMTVASIITQDWAVC